MSDTKPLLSPPATRPSLARDRAGTVPTLVSSITPSVEHTVARWSEEILDPCEVDWSAVLLGALQHRVEGLCADALVLAGWEDAAPPSVLGLLERRRLAAEARFQAHYLALRELCAADPELAAQLVVVNGAALVRLYAAASHRLLDDVDLLVPPEYAERFAARARAAGFWEKAGPAGPTFFRETTSGAAPPDAGPVVLDVRHARGAVEPGHLAPLVLGDVELRRFRGERELVRQARRLQRHAASWVHWTLEDDVRLIHLLDVELLAGAAGSANGDAGGPGAVLDHARALDAVASLALGLAVVKAVRGTVPAALEALAPLADVVAPCTRLLALPSGEVVDTGEPLARRALALDKSARARNLVPVDGDGDGDDRVARPAWCTWRRAPAGDDRGLAEIEARAHARLAKAGFVEPRRGPC